MIRLTDLVGQPTVSLADAVPTGTVRGIVTDGDRIVAVHNGDGVIDAAVIRSFEGDAVTYDGDVRAADRDADSPLGRRVLDVDDPLPVGRDPQSFDRKALRFGHLGLRG